MVSPQTDNKDCIIERSELFIEWDYLHIFSKARRLGMIRGGVVGGRQRGNVNASDPVNREQRAKQLS